MSDQEENAHAPEETDAQACDTCDNRMHDNQIIARASANAGNSTDNAAEDAQDADAYEVEDTAETDTTHGAAETADDMPSAYLTTRKDFRHHLFGGGLIVEYHACHVRTIDGPLAIWNEKTKRYEIGERALRRAMTSIAPSILRLQKGEVLEYLIDQAPVVEEADDEYTQFQNCVYNCATGETCDPSPDLLIPNVIPCDYIPDIDTTKAETILRSYANGDEDVLQDLREVIAVCLSRMRFTQSPFLIGGGANGKSTFIEAIQNILGDENYEVLEISSFTKQFQLKVIDGTLANFMDDIPTTFWKSSESAIYKRMVTGEVLHSDVKYGDDYKFRPHATIVTAANEYPRIADRTPGMERRLFPIPFNRTFKPEDRDPKISKWIKTEEARQQFVAISARELPGLYERRAFSPTDASAEIVAEMMENSDPVRQWISDKNIVRENIYYQDIHDVYQNYRNYCADNKAYDVGQNQLTRTIQQLFSVKSTPYTTPDGRSSRRYVPTGPVQVRDGEDIDDADS